MNFTFDFNFSIDKIKPPPPFPLEGKTVSSQCRKTQRIHFDAEKRVALAVASQLLSRPPSDPNGFFNKRVIFYASTKDGVSTTYKINKNSFIKRLGIDPNIIEKGKIYDEQSMQDLIKKSAHKFNVIEKGINDNCVAPTACIIKYEKGKTKTKDVVPTEKSSIGAGVGGKVYVHKKSKKLVVKKACYNMENEFEVGKRIKGHPLFVETYDLYIKCYPATPARKDKHKLVMDRVIGLELTARMKYSKIDKEKTLNILESLKSGISFLYDKEVVWRDVNSGNIMITADHQAKIIDYGMWEIEQDPEVRTKLLLTGAVEVVGWIMRGSFIRGSHRRPNEKNLVFPNEFFKDNKNMPDSIVSLFAGHTDWLQYLHIELLDTDQERKDFLIRYIDLVITEFKKEEENQVQ